MDGVGGDEAELFATALHDFRSGLLPPEHDEVGGLGDVAFPGFAEGFGVAVAEGVAHAGGSDEGRISDDVIRLRPLGAAGIFVIEEGDGGGFVRDFLAGDGVGLGGVAVPEGEDFPADGIAARDFLVVGEHGVLLADGLGFREQRAVAGVGLAGGFALPLEVADPEDELGDGDGVVGEFEAEELLGADFVFVHLEGGVATEGGDEFEHLGFEALHVFEGDVEEVGGAAGGIEDFDFAEVSVEIGDELEGFGVLLVSLGAEFLGGGGDFLGGGGDAEGFDFLVHFRSAVLGGISLAVEVGSGDLGGVPLVAQGLDDGGADEALDVGARGVFRT